MESNIRSICALPEVDKRIYDIKILGQDTSVVSSVKKVTINEEEKFIVFFNRSIIRNIPKDILFRNEIIERTMIYPTTCNLILKIEDEEDENCVQKVKEFVHSYPEWQKHSAIMGNVLFISKYCFELFALFQKPKTKSNTPLAFKLLGIEAEMISNFSFYEDVQSEEENAFIPFNSDCKCLMEANDSDNPIFVIMNATPDGIVIERKSFKELASFKLLEQHSYIMTNKFHNNEFYVAHIPFDEMSDKEKNELAEFGVEENKDFYEDEFLGKIYQAKADDKEDIRRFIHFCAALFNSKGRIPISIREKGPREKEAEFLFMKFLRPNNKFYQITVKAEKRLDNVPIQNILNKLKDDLRVYSITIDPLDDQGKTLFVFCETEEIAHRIEKILASDFEVAVSIFDHTSK